MLLVAGDITDYGTPRQIEHLKKIIDAKLKPETVLVAAIGNHDVHDNMFKSHLGGLPFYEALGKRMYDGATTDEIAVGNYHRVINGFHFLTLAHHDYHSGKSEQEDLDWLRGQLEKATADTPDRPVFLALHPVLHNTIFGSDEGLYWRTDNLSDLLRDFPQVMAFSGHLHFPLNDERIIFQDGFTAVGTAAVYYGSLPSEYKGHKFIEIVYGFEPYDCDIVSQALIVEVDVHGTTRLRRFDLTNNAEIRQPWIVPPVSTGKQPYLWTARCAKNKAPQFPDGAYVQVTSFSESRITFTFPAAADDDMVCSYKVSFTPRDDGETRTIMTYSDFYRHPKVEDMSETVTRTVTKKDLQCDTLASSYLITVRALDSFGAFSKPIVNHPSADAVQIPELSPVIPSLMSGTVCQKVYDFNFWEKGRKNIGGISDSSAYLGSSDGAGVDYTVEAVPYGSDGGAAMKVTVVNPEAKAGCRTISIILFHPGNPYFTQTYPDSTAFSFLINAAGWKGNLKIFPMIYEHDFQPDGTPSGITLFAPKSSFPYYIEKDGALLCCEGHGEMCLPPQYIGRVYLPLTADAVEPTWGTTDDDGKFDGQVVSRLLFVLTDLGVPGSSFVMNDIAIHGKK